MEITEEIRTAFDRCQRLYPTVALSFEDYLARVERVLFSGHEAHAGSRDERPCSDCLSLSRQLCHEDLFLATACVLGDRIAWEYFADQHLTLLKRFAVQACRNPDEGEDLAQELVVLLLGDSDASATATSQTCESTPAPFPGRGKLQSYNGRGSLAGWLRVIVAHAAIDRFRRARREAPLDDADEVCLARRTAGAAGTAEELPDTRWGPVLAECVRKNIAALCPRDRLILRLHHLQGVSLKAIGRRFGVHEATASRWLERIRREIRKNAELELRKAHGLQKREIQSLWRWVADSDAPLLEDVTNPEPEDIAVQEKLQGGTI